MWNLLIKNILNVYICKIWLKNMRKIIVIKIFNFKICGEDKKIDL